jgi:hypothetical protein
LDAVGDVAHRRHDAAVLRDKVKKFEMMDVHGWLKCLANPARRGKKQFAGSKAWAWERRRPAGQYIPNSEAARRA